MLTMQCPLRVPVSLLGAKNSQKAHWVHIFKILFNCEQVKGCGGFSLIFKIRTTNIITRKYCKNHHVFSNVCGFSSSFLEITVTGWIFKRGFWNEDAFFFKGRTQFPEKKPSIFKILFQPNKKTFLKLSFCQRFSPNFDTKWKQI